MRQRKYFAISLLKNSARYRTANNKDKKEMEQQFRITYDTECSLRGLDAPSLRSKFGLKPVPFSVLNESSRLQASNTANISSAATSSASTSPFAMQQVVPQQVLDNSTLSLEKQAKTNLNFHLPISTTDLSETTLQYCLLDCPTTEDLFAQALQAHSVNNPDLPIPSHIKVKIFGQRDVYILPWGSAGSMEFILEKVALASCWSLEEPECLVLVKCVDSFG
ncbi:hypothetical protein MMC12_007164 [Toensbergia leucococca]|nr:hypothetical protein [Toensbergia leucococca]